MDFIKSLINILGRLAEVDFIKSGITPGTLGDEVDFIKSGITPGTLDAEVSLIIRCIFVADPSDLTMLESLSARTSNCSGAHPMYTLVAPAPVTVTFTLRVSIRRGRGWTPYFG